MTVLYYFSTKHCTKCRMMSRFIDQLNIPVELKKIDCDENVELTNMYHIQSVPTFILIKQDQEVWRTSTPLPQSILEQQIRSAYHDSTTT